MTVKKSQRRRINDAVTPTAKMAGNYYNPVIEISVHPAGQPEKTVTFVLSSWQWSDLATQVKQVGRKVASRYRNLAASYERDAGVTGGEL